MPKVSIVRCEEYGPKLLDAATQEIFAALSLAELFKPGMKIVIKPNLLLGRAPDRATTTHPEVIAAVARALKKLGVTNITLAESPGGRYTPGTLRSVYSACGMNALKNEGVKLNYGCSQTSVDFPQGLRLKRIDVITPLLEADAIIDIAKLKTHAMAGYSGAVKNMFGAVPGLLKPELHFRFPDKEDFGEMLVDVCECVRPALSIIDAVWCMEGDGPSGGDKRFGGLLLAGIDPYSLDMIGAQIACCRDISTVKSAVSRGLCPAGTNEIEIAGVPLTEAVIPNFKQPKSVENKFLKMLPRRIATPRPSVVKRACTGCAKCAESCPHNVIDINEKKARIKYDGCIKCFCCHEMCPVKAIKIKRFKLFDI